MTKLALVTYDTRAGVFSVELGSGKVARTVEFDDSHLVDVAADGTVLSIEVLTPEDPKIEEMAARFGFVDRVEEILEAIDAALAPRVETGITASFGFQVVQGSTRQTGNGHNVVHGRSAGSIPPREIDLVP